MSTSSSTAAMPPPALPTKPVKAESICGNNIQANTSMLPPPPPPPRTAVARSVTTPTQGSSAHEAKAEQKLANIPSDTPISSKPAPSADAYTPPSWAGRPTSGDPPVTLDVIREGTEIGQLNLSQDSQHHYIFGRMQGGGVHFVLEHPTISRLHAVLQFRREDGAFFLQDLGSTHGTQINRKGVEPRQWVQIHVGDMLQFGQSTRYYLVNGPEDLRPPEEESEELKFLRERSAKRQARKEAEKKKEREEEDQGISWGMDEDAVEDEEEEEGGENGVGGEGEAGEVNGHDKPKSDMQLPDYLQNLPEHRRRAFEKGREGGLADQLRQAEQEVHERDRKLFDKVRARAIKIENMETEISRIYAKESGQGGLSEGQQAAVARNESRIAVLRGEIEQFEDQIRGKSAQRMAGMSKEKGETVQKRKNEDDEDEDEFYNRADNEKGGNWRMRRKGRGLKGPKMKEKGKAGAASSEAETYNTLTVKLAAVQEQLVTLEAAKPPEDGYEATKGQDSLESYLADNEAKKRAQALQDWKKRHGELTSEVTRLQKLVKIAKPALPPFKSRKAEESTETSNKSPSKTSSALPVHTTADARREEEKGRGMFKKIQQLQGGGAHPPSQHPQINLDSLTGSEDSQKEEQQAAQAGGVVPANLMGTPGSALLDGEPITPNIRPPSPTRVSAAAAEGGGTPAVAGGGQVAEGAKGGVSVGAPLSVRKAARGREKEGGGGSVLLRAEGQPLPAQELHGRDAGVGLLAEGEGARLVEEGMPLSSLGSLRPESTGEDLPPAASAATPTTDGDDVSGRSEVVRGKDGEKKRPGRGQTKQEGKRRKLAVLSRDLGERQVEGGVREDEEEVGPAYVGYFQKPLGKDRQEELKRKLGY